MKPRVTAKQFKAKEPDLHPQKKPIPFLETKIFIQKEFNLLDDKKNPDKEIIKSNSKLATRIKALIAYEEKHKDIVVSYHKTQRISPQTLKTEIEQLSKFSWSKADEQYHRYLVRFLAELYRYKKTIVESQHHDFYFYAAQCLHQQCANWATKHNGWSEAYEAAITPKSNPTKFTIASILGFTLFVGLSHIVKKATANTCPSQCRLG